MYPRQEHVRRRQNTEADNSEPLGQVTLVNEAAPQLVEDFKDHDHRVIVGGISSPQTAAIFSQAGVLCQGITTEAPEGLVVIDHFIVGISGAAAIVTALASDSGSLGAGTQSQAVRVRDTRIGAAAAQASIAQMLENHTLAAQQGTVIGSFGPIPSNTSLLIPVAYVLSRQKDGTGRSVSFSPVAVNIGITVWFVGREYELVGKRKG